MKLAIIVAHRDVTGSTGNDLLTCVGGEAIGCRFQVGSVSITPQVCENSTADERDNRTSVDLHFQWSIVVDNNSGKKRVLFIARIDMKQVNRF